MIKHIYKIVVVSLFCILIVISFELLIAKNINDKIDINVNQNKKIFKLHETNYYRNGGIKKDPYKNFVELKLHPYYIFGFPLDEKFIIKNLNNEHASLDERKFRKSIKFENKKNILITGGSTAFGHYASSDEKTIASYISKLTAYNGVNLNAPSWNSFQETVALIKHNSNFEYSFSISSVNDYIIYCANDINQKFVPDSPDFFPSLNSILNNEKPSNKFNQTKIQYFKAIIEQYFPSSVEFYVKIKKKILKNDVNIKPEKNEIKENKEINNLVSCGGAKSIDLIVNKFLENQKIMRDYSLSKNAEHWLIIQPNTYHHKGTDKPSDYDGMQYYLNEIINSEFCKYRCLDYSNVFENYVGDKLLLKVDYTDIESPKKSIFVDTYHLTDIGNKILVENIIKDINSISKK